MLDNAVIRKFSPGLRGHLLLIADSAYTAARWSWNRAVDRHLGLIVRSAGSEDVVRAVDFARTHELLVAVRSGGHSCNRRRGGVVSLGPAKAAQKSAPTLRPGAWLGYPISV